MVPASFATPQGGDVRCHNYMQLMTRMMIMRMIFTHFFFMNANNSTSNTRALFGPIIFPAPDSP